MKISYKKIYPSKRVKDESQYREVELGRIKDVILRGRKEREFSFIDPFSSNSDDYLHWLSPFELFAAFLGYEIEYAGTNDDTVYDNLLMYQAAIKSRKLESKYNQFREFVISGGMLLG